MSDNTQDRNEQEKVFAATINILRRQREANADTVVQLSVQTMRLEQHILALEQSYKTLQSHFESISQEYNALLNKSKKNSVSDTEASKDVVSRVTVVGTLTTMHDKLCAIKDQLQTEDCMYQITNSLGQLIGSCDMWIRQYSNDSDEE